MWGLEKDTGGKEQGVFDQTKVSFRGVLPLVITQHLISGHGRVINGIGGHGLKGLGG